MPSLASPALGTSRTVRRIQRRRRFSSRLLFNPTSSHIYSYSIFHFVPAGRFYREYVRSQSAHGLFAPAPGGEPR